MRYLLLAAAALLTVGLAASLFSSQMGGSGKRSKHTVDMINIAFTPRGCLGSGSSSPLFWVAWALIYTLNLTAAFYLLVRGFSEDHDGSERDDDLFNAAACIGAAFFLTASWSPLFSKVYASEREANGWALWFSAVVIIFAAILAVVGVAYYRPGLDDGSLDALLFLGVPWGLFAGWLLVAASIGVNLAAANENHVEHRGDAKNPSVEPVIGALLAAAAATALGSPGIAVPMLVACAFVSVTWASVVAAVIALLGVAGGVVVSVVL